ncbi:ABC-type Fe3+/spermidine/putrescine transport system ATPase subunit [Paraburkholderia sp. BL6665CI2N2]|nr:ABC-type Fe3+/spermidine/putrescine transport system ATPase subunit [Paraburkholderia sp. BL6665CI2N2]
MNSITTSLQPSAKPRSRLRRPDARTWLATGQWLVTLLLCAFLIVPVVMSIMAGLTVNYFKGVSSGLTLRWLGEVWTQYHSSVFLSLEVAAATLLITLLTGVPAGYVLARSKTRLSRIIEEFLVLPIALPGLASALALLVVYGGFTMFRMSVAFIVVGHVVFTLPFMVRAVAAVCASSDLRTLEEGAASLGASFFRRFVTIVLPNARPGIVAGALAVLTLSIGEFNLTWMLHTPDTKTLPVGLADTYASLRIEIGSAYTILFFIMTMPLLVAMQWLGVDATGQRSAAKKTHRGTSFEVHQAMKLASVPITLTQCAKTFRGTRVLEPLDLHIDAGETLVLLGPSGCGKTTTLRMIAGLETPDAGGRIAFGDDDVTALPIEKRQVGMVFQSYALFPNLTVRGNISYGLKIKRVPAETARQRVDELLGMMRLTAHADKPIDQLSGGQRQRVALARALAVQPRVLLLDEPLTALDARLRDTLRSEMNTLLRDLGITTVYVTHDQAEAMELGDRIVVMSAGRIEQIGSPREIYYRPANRTVAQFVGTINRLAGERRDGMLSTTGGTVPLPAGSVHANSAHEIFFRPEDAYLADPAHAQLRGHIESTAFLGERTRLTIGGAAPDALLIDVAGRVELARGTPVGISIAQDALIALS